MLVLLLILERLVAAGQVMIDYYIPDTPFSVRLEHKRHDEIERRWTKRMVDPWVKVVSQTFNAQVSWVASRL